MQADAGLQGVTLFGPEQQLDQWIPKTQVRGRSWNVPSLSPADTKGSRHIPDADNTGVWLEFHLLLQGVCLSVAVILTHGSCPVGGHMSDTLHTRYLRFITVAKRQF